MSPTNFENNMHSKLIPSALNCSQESVDFKDNTVLAVRLLMSSPFEDKFAGMLSQRIP